MPFWLLLMRNELRTTAKANAELTLVPPAELPSGCVELIERSRRAELMSTGEGEGLQVGSSFACIKFQHVSRARRANKDPPPSRF